MSRIVRCGLIQASCTTPAEESLEQIKRDAIEKHLKLIEQAAAKGAKIVCLQEIFTGPYFCAEQSSRWYDMVEKIPEGPTIQLMREVAKQRGIALVVPIYEEELKGIRGTSANFMGRVISARRAGRSSPKHRAIRKRSSSQT